MLSHAIFILFVDFPDLLRIDTHFVVLVVFPFCCCNPFVVETVVQVLLTWPMVSLQVCFSSDAAGYHFIQGLINNSHALSGWQHIFRPLLVSVALIGIPMDFSSRLN